jgi:hypothetical protein
VHAVTEAGTGEPADRARARARGARVWAMRGRAEREAAARFARLATRLDAVGAEPIVVGLARRACADEGRHAVRCDELVARLSGRTAPPETVYLRLPELGPGGLTAREAVLYEVVAMSCITETLSTALLGEMRDAAAEGRVREVLSEILKDEVQHARLGWAHLAAERRRGPQRFLAAALPRMLDDTAGAEVFQAGEPDAMTVGDALRGLGALPRSERRARLAETLEQVVFPGLESQGVDAGAGRAWLARRLAAA